MFHWCSLTAGVYTWYMILLEGATEERLCGKGGGCLRKVFSHREGILTGGGNPSPTNRAFCTDQIHAIGRKRQVLNW